MTAKQGGQIAGNARVEIEKETNKAVVTSANANDILLQSTVVGMIEGVVKNDESE